MEPRELKWFEERKGTEIEMKTPDQKLVKALVSTDNEAFYYYNLQKTGFTFKEL